MRPDTSPQFKTEGSKAASTTHYSIDTQAMSNIMGLLTSIYSDPITAVVREYAANALDSHVEAGQTRPIEVEIGSSLNPQLVVRDFGIGLSREDALRLFSMYGASTKRDTDEQVGSFGIGSKSALAYANTMTITARKDGQQTIIILRRDDDGVGALDEVANGPTFEPNGVEISIPIQRHDAPRFHEAAQNMFRFWSPGTALVNGKPTTVIDGEWITDEFRLTPVGTLTSDYVVMGNVAYPINQSKSPVEQLTGHRFVYRRQSLVIYAPIGAGSLAPSREELQYTPKTTKYLQEAVGRFSTVIAKESQAVIDAASTPAEAFLKALEFRGGSFVRADHAFTYKGKTIPTTIDSDRMLDLKRQGYNHGYGTSYKPGFLVVNPDRYGRDKHTYLSSLEPSNIQRLIDGKSIIVTGYDTVKDDGHQKSTTPAHREKMQYWAEQNGHDYDSFILYHEFPGDGWLKGMPEIDWDTIRTIKLPSTGPRAIAKKLPLREVTGGNYYNLTTREIDIADLGELDGKPLVIASPTDYRDDYSKENLRRMVKSLPEYRFVLVGSNRFDRVKREAPVDVYTMTELTKNLQERIDALSQHDWDVWHTSHEGFDQLPKSGLDDPDLVRYNGTRKETDGSLLITRAINAVGKYVLKTKDRSSDILSKQSITARYPLMQQITRPEPHVEIYLNTIYEREVK